MSIFVLPHDAWAAVGQYMSPASLSNVSATCQHVHDRVWSNQALWSLQSANRWRSLSQWGIVDDAKGLYRAGHLAACRVNCGVLLLLLLLFALTSLQGLVGCMIIMYLHASAGNPDAACCR